MISETVVHGFAVIGAIAVALAAIAVLYLGALVLPMLIERVFQWASKKAFYMGGGRTHKHEDGSRWPTPPYDRLWMEFRWLQGVAKLAQKKVGVRDWVGNPAERYDVEKFYEKRQEKRHEWDPDVQPPKNST